MTSISFLANDDPFFRSLLRIFLLCVFLYQL